MKFKRLLSMGIAATAMSLAISPTSAQEPQYGGEMVYAITSQTFSLFPGRQNGSGAQDAWLYALEGLVEITEDNTVIPWLAESWEFSDDGRQATFKLREGIDFHDGTPFNAEAVAFVFNEAKRADFAYENLLEGLVEVVADDEYTATFHFDKPFAALIPNLAYRSMVIFSPTAYKEKGEEWLATNIVGTGPFIFEEQVVGEFVQFRKNDDYWQEGLPYLDSVKILIVPDVSARSAMLEAGEVDRTKSLNDFDAPRLDADPNINFRKVNSTRQFYTVLNHTKHPFSSVNVRKAVNYAIDKEGIVASVFAGQGAVLSHAPVLSPGVVGFTDKRNPGDNTIFPYNPDLARKLLKNAGFEDRDGNGVVEDPQGKEFSINMFGRKGVTKGDDGIAELLQSMLGDVGIDVEIQFMEASAFSAAVKLGPTDAQYDTALLSWGIPTADADEPMMLMMYTPAWKPNGANRSFYSSEEVDRLTVLAHHEVDPDQRNMYIDQWMDELLKDAPVIFLPTLTFNLGTRTYLHDDRILSIDQYPARFAWIDKEEKARQGINNR
jgi:ABC-type transport system substrate-binding protein